MFNKTIAHWFYKVFPKPLSQDVIETFETVKQLDKLGLNDEDPEDVYKYLRIVDLCEAFKAELFRRGVLVTANDIDRTFEQISEGNGNYSIRCTVETEFAAVRGKDRLVLGKALGSAQSHSDKALAVAQTAAFKALLKRSSMTYGKEDDPEVNRGETPGPKESVRIASYQRRALDAALRNSGISSMALCATMTKKLGFQITVEQIADLPPGQFDEAMKLILGAKDDLTETWSAAVVDIGKRKQQIAGD